jgi:hypothetical protein
MLHKLYTAVSCLALSAAAAGCFVVARESPPPPAGVGSLTAYWTLDGSTDPDLCWYYGVDRVDVAIYDFADRTVTWAQPHCEDFGVSFDGLVDDSYTLEATLLDVGGVPLSDTIVVDTDVWRDRETIVDINFPGAIIY